jgi:hypothetical protein
VREEAGEGCAIGEVGRAAGEGQLGVGEGPLEAGQVLRAEDRGEGAGGEEKPGATRDPV